MHYATVDERDPFCFPLFSLSVLLCRTECTTRQLTSEILPISNRLLSLPRPFCLSFHRIAEVMSKKHEATYAQTRTSSPQRWPRQAFCPRPTIPSPLLPRSQTHIAAPRASPGLWFPAEVGKISKLMGRAVRILEQELYNTDVKPEMFDFRSSCELCCATNPTVGQQNRREYSWETNGNTSQRKLGDR